MAILNPIQESDVARRARGYWRADGIPLLLGAFIYSVFLGIFCFLWFNALRLSDFKGNWFSESFVGPFVGFAIATMPFWLLASAIWLAGNWEDLVEWFKLRLTYPRTGYVTPPSYWPGESNPESLDTDLGLTQTRLCRLLTFLGGFWFWTFVQLWKGRPSDWVLLIVLLTIRSLRYAIYPERHTSSHDWIPRLKSFFRSVLNSFWFWCWSAGILSHVISGVPKVVTWGLSIAMTLLAIRILYQVRSITLLHFLFCAVFCVLLFWKGTTASTILAFFVPGIYAATVGTFRLARYLRANPVPQI